MSYTEFCRKKLPCCTLIYSYTLCNGGYLINIRNLDSGEDCTTVGVDVPRQYMLEIMERLVENEVTPDAMNDVLTDELNNYLAKFPPEKTSFGSKYLYL